jgi:HK97 family phage prohead protease
MSTATSHPQAPEQRTVTADVQDVRAEGRTLRGFAAVYGVESRDLGGFTERIQQGAFTDALAGTPDVLLTLNHSPDRVLARTSSGTLRLADEQRGLAFEADLGDGPTAQDVRDMVRRGDLSGASFRFRVAPDGERWDGERRTLTRIAELHDISLATVPAYDGPRVELRTRPDSTPTENTMTAAQQRQEDTAMNVEDRTTTGAGEGGGLQVEHRAAVTREQPRGLAEELRAAGFPAETATVPFEHFEDRAVTWTGPVDGISPVARQAGPLGADQRYAWPAFGRVPVEPGDTSVQVMTQTARSLPAAQDVVRPIDATTPKPEVGSTLAVVPLSLRQVAAIQTGIPNLFLEQSAFNSVIEGDLRLAINEGLDKLVLDAVAGSGVQAPGTDELLVSIRKAITTLQAVGYQPDVLILTPQAAEALDVLVSGVSGGSNDYVFAPANFAPGTIFGLTKRISKTAAAPIVADTQAFGRLYTSPVSLARFEADGGTTNRSNVRLELHAAFGVERLNAAVRIAAS